MRVLSEEEMVARLDFMRPLHPPEEPKDGQWCIPFEYGGLAKGTRISIAKAREIAAELRAAVAEAEKRELRLAFDDERKRSESLGAQFSAQVEKTQDALMEVAILKKRLRKR